jgi:hypothetical protein
LPSTVIVESPGVTVSSMVPVALALDGGAGAAASTAPSG